MEKRNVKKDKSLTKKNLIIYMILIIFATIISIQSCFSPTNSIGYISRDVSIWTSIAKRMSQGQIIYRDMFDHKGPILYFIYYIGYILGKYMGIWIIDCICNIVNVIMIYKISELILKNYKKSLIITGMSVMYMFFLCEENPCTESIALPFILLSLYKFIKFIINAEEFKTKDSLCTGICFGIVLLLRPNLAAIWVVYYLYIFVKLIIKKQVKQLFYIIIINMLGFMIGFIPVFLYLIINGAFIDFINTYILFNLKYTSNKEVSLITTAKFFVQNTNYIIAIIGAFYIGLIGMRKKLSRVDYEFIKVGFIYFVFTFYLIIMPQRTYMHYVITMLPTLIIPLIVTFKYINLNKYTNILIVLIFILYIAFYNKNINTRDKLGYTLLFNKISKQVQELTEKDDNVFVLGNEAVIYLMSDRQYNGKYLYQFPIANQSEEIENEVIEEIERDLPDLIVSFLNINKEQNLTSTEQKIKRILDSNYIPKTNRIYVRK